MKFRLCLTIVLTISMLPGKSAIAQAVSDTLLARQIDSLVHKRLPDVAPGAVILISKHGKIVYNKALGFADVERKVLMQANRLFRIGSITKQYTAIAILQLAEQGKLSLQDSIQKFVKAYPHKGYPVTIKNLLSQTSGIVDYMAITKHDPANEHDHYTPAQGVDYFKAEPLLFEPGTRFRYSNSNYYLAGYIIEQVTGLPYATYLQQFVFSPAGLTHTSYLSAAVASSGLVKGYVRNSNQWAAAELQEPSILYAAGGLVADAEDLFKWHQALADQKLVKKETLAEAYRPYRFPDGSLSEYGYGWYLRKLDGSATIEHSGSTDGYQCDEIYLPEQDVFVATLFNGFEEDMDWVVLSNDIARLATGKPLMAAIALTDKAMQQLAGTYIYNTEHQLKITFSNHQLYVEAVNPKEHLPRVLLYADSPTRFHIKEAVLSFEFHENSAGHLQLTTYNARGKDADWQKDE